MIDQIKNILGKNITAREKYRLIYGKDAPTRHIARHAIDKLRKEYDVNVFSGETKETFKINNNGTQESTKLLSCCFEDIKDPIYLLDAHGFDPNKFELVSANSSIWDGGKDNTKKYSSKIVVRPRKSEFNLKEMVQQAIDSCDFSGVKSITERKNTTNRIGGKTLEICLADLHFGLTDENGNETWDNFSTVSGKIMDFICRNAKDIDEVVVVFLGDLFHYDTKGKTTTAGTPQDSAVSFEKAYEYASKALINFLSELNIFCDFRIVYVPGNHDALLGYTLVSMLGKVFNISINSNSNRTYIKIYDNLIGYTHGDMNQKNIMKWIYTDAKEEISSSNVIEIHCGHFHSERVMEGNGVTIRYMPSLSDLSPWEKSMGYTHHKRIGCCLWTKDGLESINYF